MNPVHPARRRAERFDAAIEDSSTPLDPRTAELVALVSALRTCEQPTPRAEFVSDLRTQLMLAAETDLVAISRTRDRAPQKSRRERRIAVALGGLALVGATTSMAVAAQSALPGEVLYPLKRAIEDADTGLSAQGDKGTELLDHASGRLRELDALTQDGKADASHAAVIESTLESFADQATQASDLLLASYEKTGSEDPITQLRTFTGSSLSSLGRLEAELPPAVRPAVLDAAKVLFGIDQSTTSVCPECAGAGITDIPDALLASSTDTLGAVPPPSTTLVVPKGSGRSPGKAEKSKPAVVAPTGNGPTPSAPPTDPEAGGLLTDESGSGSAAGQGGGGTVTNGLGGLLGTTGKGPKTGASAPAPLTAPTIPAAPLPDLGEVVQDTVDGIDQLTDPVTGTLTQP